MAGYVAQPSAHRTCPRPTTLAKRPQLHIPNRANQSKPPCSPLRISPFRASTSSWLVVHGGTAPCARRTAGLKLDLLTPTVTVRIGAYRIFARMVRRTGSTSAKSRNAHAPGCQHRSATCRDRGSDHDSRAGGSGGGGRRPLFVIGHPGHYPEVGFRNASANGVASPSPGEPALMVRGMVRHGRPVVPRVIELAHRAALGAMTASPSLQWHSHRRSRAITVH